MKSTSLETGSVTLPERPEVALRTAVPDPFPASGVSLAVAQRLMRHKDP